MAEMTQLLKENKAEQFHKFISEINDNKEKVNLKSMIKTIENDGYQDKLFSAAQETFSLTSSKKIDDSKLENTTAMNNFLSNLNKYEFALVLSTLARMI